MQITVGCSWLADSWRVRFPERRRRENKDSGFGWGLSRRLKVAGNRGEIDTGGCGYWQGHYFA